MIRINLLPEVKRKAPKRVKVARQIPFTWIISALIAVILAGAASLFIHLRMVDELHKRQQQMAQIQEDIKQYKVHQGLVEQARKQRNALAQKLEIISTLKKRQTGPVRLLDELAGAIPAKLWVTEMNETTSSMSLSGYSLDHKQIALFMENLEKSPIFSNVELVSSTAEAQAGKTKGAASMPVKSFQLNCQLNVLKEM
ncbi:MAG: PilN domain-containing protein [Myxococcales bacterium]|nr:PilN domain-containing protein [Myxococcales bacterium]